MSKLLGVILDTMWGDRRGLAPRWFPINPHNHSGRRLYTLTGMDHADPIWVSNVCRELTTSARDHGTPNPTWLLENLNIGVEQRGMRLFLLCGKVVQNTYDSLNEKVRESLEVDLNLKFFRIPHPAWRGWNLENIGLIRNQIQNLITNATV